MKKKNNNHPKINKVTVSFCGEKHTMLSTSTAPMFISVNPRSVWEESNQQGSTKSHKSSLTTFDDL